MKLRKKQIALTATLVGAIVWAAWISWSLINDINRHKATTDSVNAALVHLEGSDLTRMSSIEKERVCERTQVKGGQGHKFCTQHISLGANNLSINETKELIQKTYIAAGHEVNLTKKWVSNENYDKLSPNAIAATSIIVYELTDYVTSECSIRSTLRYEDSTFSQDTPGELEIDIFCNDTDWWTRNVLNKWYYPFRP